MLRAAAMFKDRTNPANSNADYLNSFHEITQAILPYDLVIGGVHRRYDVPVERNIPVNLFEEQGCHVAMLGIQHL